MSGDIRRMAELTEADCLRLLTTARVGRVVFTDAALPAVLPLTYLLRDRTVLMGTAAGSRLARVAAGGLLAFEIDELDPDTETGWSVVVTGIASVESMRAAADTAGSTGQPEPLPRPWAPGRDDQLIRLPCTQLTARRITAGYPAAEPAAR
jgi:nitroimidazol reductase NimA-like FMN-containing flavoprotein (pyridoxamine 5'-phosphate oxidase superfamily)